VTFAFIVSTISLFSFISPVIDYAVVFLRDFTKSILFKNVLRYGLVGVSDNKIQVFIDAQ